MAHVTLAYGVVALPSRPQTRCQQCHSPWRRRSARSGACRVCPGQALAGLGRARCPDLGIWLRLGVWVQLTPRGRRFCSGPGGTLPMHVSGTCVVLEGTWLRAIIPSGGAKGGPWHSWGPANAQVVIVHAPSRLSSSALRMPLACVRPRGHRPPTSPRDARQAGRSRPSGRRMRACVA